MTQEHTKPEDSLTEHIASLRSSAAGLGASDTQLPMAQSPQQAEPDYRAIVQNVNSIILCMRTDGTVLFMNDFGLSFFGYRADELFGEKCCRRHRTANRYCGPRSCSHDRQHRPAPRAVCEK